MDIKFLIDNGVDVEKSLELFGDIETYNDTIGDFLISVEDKIPKLETYKNNKDMNNYAIYAHSLKSDARTFGFTKLFDMAYNHEMKSKAGDIYYIYDNYNELISEVNRVVHIVKQYLNKEPIEKITNQEEVIENSEEKENNEKIILVVDDSNIIRNFVSRIFKENYAIGTAKDGKEAIDIISSNKDSNSIVAILLDLNMPNVDGFAVLDYMKENDLFPKIPVSIISGDSSKETINRAFTYPIVDMLGKPFNETDVKRVVEKTMNFNEID